MTTSNLHYFPIAVFLMFPLTFAVTYSIALSKGHIKAFFSYISDTGTVAPELCIFSQLLNISAAVFACTAYIRFKQVEEVLHVTKAETETLTKLNKIGLFFGFVGAFGTSVVGCFQESNILTMHVLGAFMAFFGGAIYLTFQGFFTMHTAPLFGSKPLGVVRMIIGVICGCLFIVSYTTGALSMKYFTGERALLWEPEDGGWGLRVTSVTTEWVMAALFDVYFLTFIPEFRRVTFETPNFRIIDSKMSGKNGNHQIVNQREEIEIP